MSCAPHNILPTGHELVVCVGLRQTDKSEYDNDSRSLLLFANLQHGSNRELTEFLPHPRGDP